MPTIQFLVKNQLAAATAGRVLVFLRPALAAEGMRAAAWQTLSPPPNGGSQVFSFAGRLEAAATEDQDQGSRSARCAVFPGLALVARSRNAQGPELHPDPAGGPAGEACRVRNGDRRALRVTWYCDGRAILQETVAPGGSATFEPVKDLFLFQVREPSPDNLYPLDEVLASSVEYRRPAPACSIGVAWTADGLSFSPASEGPATPEAQAPATAPPVPEPSPITPILKRKSGAKR